VDVEVVLQPCDLGVQSFDGARVTDRVKLDRLQVVEHRLDDLALDPPDQLVVHPAGRVDGGDRHRLLALRSMI
jgi:hypothetical protein